MPGFEQAMRRLHTAGFKLVIHSVRLCPFDQWTGQPREFEAKVQALKMRAMLDAHGLTFVDIWTKPGKPAGFVYVDDRAERYNGRTTSWAKVTDKILLRAQQEAE